MNKSLTVRSHHSPTLESSLLRMLATEDRSEGLYWRYRSRRFFQVIRVLGTEIGLLDLCSDRIVHEHVECRA